MNNFYLSQFEIPQAAWTSIKERFSSEGISFLQDEGQSQRGFIETGLASHSGVTVTYALKPLNAERSVFQILPESGLEEERVLADKIRAIAMRSE